MILITGAGGNVGREVLNLIAKTGARVRAGYQSVRKAEEVPGIEAVEIDYKRPESMRIALKGVDRVFLVGPPTAALVDLERSAIDAILEAGGVQQVVKLSAMGGRGAIFPRLHTESEEYIASSGVPYTFLRPNGFMQNIVNYNGATIASQNAFYGSEGDGKISLIDIRDVAAVAVKALTEEGHVGKVYTLTGLEALTNADVAKILSRSLGREIRFVNLPPDKFKEALLSAGVSEWSANALVDLQRLYRERNAARVTQDVEQVLGRPPVRLEQFVDDHKSGFAAQKQASG
jgi:uncharacterized protein YbjT (DUF2867 family)